MRAGLLLLACTVLAVAVGCTYVAPVIPPTGMVFSSISAPMDVDMEKTELGHKRGEASTISVLWLFGFGDASIGAAAENGGLMTIDHADYKFLSILFGLFSSFTTVVYGS